MYLGYINSVLNPLIYDMDFKLKIFADSRFGHFGMDKIQGHTIMTEGIRS